jgi:hypothetical protein
MLTIKHIQVKRSCIGLYNNEWVLDKALGVFNGASGEEDLEVFRLLGERLQLSEGDQTLVRLVHRHRWQECIEAVESGKASVFSIPNGTESIASAPTLLSFVLDRNPPVALVQALIDANAFVDEDRDVQKALMSLPFDIFQALSEKKLVNSFASIHVLMKSRSLPQRLPKLRLLLRDTKLDAEDCSELFSQASVTQKGQAMRCAFLGLFLKAGASADKMNPDLSPFVKAIGVRAALCSIGLRGGLYVPGEVMSLLSSFLPLPVPPAMASQVRAPHMFDALNGMDEHFAHLAHLDQDDDEPHPFHMMPPQMMPPHMPPPMMPHMNIPQPPQMNMPQPPVMAAARMGGPGMRRMHPHHRYLELNQAFLHNDPFFGVFDLLNENHHVDNQRLLDLMFRYYVLGEEESREAMLAFPGLTERMRNLFRDRGAPFRDRVREFFRRDFDYWAHGDGV